MTGTPRPSTSDRAGRLVEFFDAVADLLNGETVTRDGEYLRLVDARLDELPVDGRIKIVVGGGHPDILRAAAGRADVVALSGLGRTLPDGHSHQAAMGRHELESQLRVIQEASSAAGRVPVVEALVQQVIVTDDRSQAIDELNERVPSASPRDLADTPFC